MKKKLLTIVFPVIIAIAGSVAVWANEQVPAQPACDKCPKAEKAAPCDNCAKGQKAAKECDKCPEMKDAAGKPCGEKGCDKFATMQQTEKKPCCDKGKKL